MLWGATNSTQLLAGMANRNVWFIIFLSPMLFWFWDPLVAVFALSLKHGQYSHIILMPFLSLYILYLERKAVFTRVEWSLWPGLILTVGGGALFASTGVSTVDKVDILTLAILSMVTMCWGAFLLVYGSIAFRKAFFGLSLLLFMVPFPTLLLEATIGFLQRGSTEGVDILFGLLGVPVYRQGFVFVLPNLTIQVAEECSGIRSSLALLISSLVAGHFFLRSSWTRMTLVLLVVPLTIVKNAIRIVVLSLLGNYVHPSFITDSVLHHYGGIPLFFVTLAVLGAFVWLLQRAEAELPSLVIRRGLMQARATRGAPGCPN